MFDLVCVQTTINWNIVFLLSHILVCVYQEKRYHDDERSMEKILQTLVDVHDYR